LNIFEEVAKEMKEAARKDFEYKQLDFLKYEMKAEIESMINREKEALENNTDDFHDLIEAIFHLKGQLIFGFEGKTADVMVKTMERYHSKIVDDGTSIDDCIKSCKTYDGWF